MKYVIPEKKFTWQYGICLTFKTYRRLESQQKAWIFPSFDDVQDNSLLKQFLLETKILKVLQKARGNTLDKEGLKILMNSLKNALRILNSLDTDTISRLGIQWLSLATRRQYDLSIGFIEQLHNKLINCLRQRQQSLSWRYFNRFGMFDVREKTFWSSKLFFIMIIIHHDLRYWISTQYCLSLSNIVFWKRSSD